MAYSPIGRNNNTAAAGTGSAADNAVDRELYLKKLATDVLRYFMDTNVARPLVTNRSIDAGKSEAFPIVGNIDAVEILNDALELPVQTLTATEREIVIGNLTVAHSFITDMDSAMVHYDAKAAHTESIGRSLAKIVDKRIIEEVIKASDVIDAPSALAALLLPFDDDIYTAKVTVEAGKVTLGSEIYAKLIEMNTEYVEKDIIGEPVYLLRPASYFAVLNNPMQTGLTWVNDEFSQSGKVPLVMGRRVMMSPHFPAYTVAGVPTVGACQGLLFAKESVGVLELLSVSMRSDYIPLRLANLTVGKMALGYGILNHGAAIKLEVIA